ncbi:hypothetical protein [Pectobacterium polaris]|uniref:hypothetical protein n=1 Tax=Pectobacterium polaris TaxID=2042057 RepID=UPI00352F844D
MPQSSLNDVILLIVPQPCGLLHHKVLYHHLNLNNYTYKVNFNSTNGVESHGEVHHATVL